MPSTITGVFPRRVITINDFQGSPPANPKPGMKAEAHPGINNAGAASESFIDGGETLFRLRDSFTVDVVWDTAASWVLPSVHNDSASEQARLFNHEQGHYDIAALIARDFFIEMMALKGARMSSASEVTDAVRDLFARYPGNAQALQGLYDDPLQTNHGRTQTKQDDWDGFFHTAYTEERVPQVLAPDGKAYKKPIYEVLADNGITFP
ncbi:MAG: hypothetical protein HKN25_02280 [Pyrinomonadaceae bacterium]|nr:hypothetical protein [Pyrinomonadaceae bacterium]